MEKMSLYEIEYKIAEVLATMVDPETGEIKENADEMLEELDMARGEKIENIACYIKNLRAFAEDLKEEKMALAKRQAAVEKKAEWLTKYLQKALNGEAPKTAKYAISYRKSESVVFTDEHACAVWLKNKGFKDECLKIETSVIKSEVKKLLQEGLRIKGAELQQNINMQIK